MIKLLLRHDGIDVNRAREDGATPLYMACCKGHRAVVELLLQHDGIGVNQAMYGGATPLYIACCEGHSAVVKLLLRHDGIGDVNRACEDGATPLISASYSGHWRIVKLLLGEGANVDARFRGLTALQFAQSKGHRSCVRALKERRCVVCHVTRKGLGRKLRKCGACLRVVYCSEACQAEHWEQHKEVCGAARDNEQ